MSKRSKTRRVKIRRDDVPNMVDAFFYGSPERLGQVEMYCNQKGRGIIDDLFPKAIIRWTTESESMGAGWVGFEINLPEVVANTPTKLPLDVMPTGMAIEDCSPQQFALLLAFGVLRGGGRSAISDGETMSLFTGRDN